MDISDYINIAAIIFAPVISVMIGQKLQDRAKRRQDKMEILRHLCRAEYMDGRMQVYTP